MSRVSTPPQQQHPLSHSSDSQHNSPRFSNNGASVDSQHHHHDEESSSVNHSSSEENPETTNSNYQPHATPTTNHSITLFSFQNNGENLNNTASSGGRHQKPFHPGKFLNPHSETHPDVLHVSKFLDSVDESNGKDQSSPPLDQNPDLIHKLVLGVNHALLLTNEQHLYTRAPFQNTHGQLGTGTTEPSPQWRLLDTQVIDCDLGLHHTVYVKGDGSVYALGRNLEGQCGSAALGVDLYHPRRVPLGKKPVAGSVSSAQHALHAPRIVQVSCGALHTVLRSEEGICFAFGRGQEGQLGSLAHLKYSMPPSARKQQQQSSSSGAAASEQPSTSSSRRNAFNICKSASNPMGVYLQFQPTPKAIKCLEPQQSSVQRRRPFVNIVQVDCGEQYTSLLAADGRVFMTGEGRTGVLGRGKCPSFNYKPELAHFVAENHIHAKDNRKRSIEVAIEWERIPPPPKPKIVDQEDEEEIRDEDCTFRVRTQFDMRVIGEASEREDSSSSSEATIQADIIQVASGWNHSLLLDSQGQLWSAGLNVFGQCGLNHRKTQTKYALVPKSRALSKEQIVDIGCGSSYSAILTASGRVYVMGRVPGERFPLWGPSGDYLMATQLQYFSREGYLIRRMHCGVKELILEGVKQMSWSSGSVDGGVAQEAAGVDASFESESRRFSGDEEYNGESSEEEGSG